MMRIGHGFDVHKFGGVGAADLQCDLNRVNVKATTTEQLGFTGRKEGIATEAVVLLVKQ